MTFCRRSATAATSGLKTPSPRCTRRCGSAAVAGSSRRGCRPDCRTRSPPARGRSSAAPETKRQFTSTATWKQNPTAAARRVQAVPYTQPSVTPAPNMQSTDGSTTCVRRPSASVTSHVMIGSDDLLRYHWLSELRLVRWRPLYWYCL